MFCKVISGIVCCIVVTMQRKGSRDISQASISPVMCYYASALSPSAVMLIIVPVMILRLISLFYCHLPQYSCRFYCRYRRNCHLYFISRLHLSNSGQTGCVEKQEHYAVILVCIQPALFSYKYLLQLIYCYDFTVPW